VQLYLYRERSENKKIASELQICGQKYLVNARMARLVQADRNGTVTRIITAEVCRRASLNAQHIELQQQKTQGVPLLSDKNRKLRLQFTQAQQNWTIENWKNIACSDESQFLLQHSDGRVRIWRKQHESMDPSCLVSMVQVGGGGVMCVR